MILAFLLLKFSIHPFKDFYTNSSKKMSWEARIWLQKKTVSSIFIYKHSDLTPPPIIYVLLPITISIGSYQVEDHSQQNTGLGVTAWI